MQTNTLNVASLDAVNMSDVALRENKTVSQNDWANPEKRGLVKTSIGYIEESDKDHALAKTSKVTFLDQDNKEITTHDKIINDAKGASISNFVDRARVDFIIDKDVFNNLPVGKSVLVGSIAVLPSDPNFDSESVGVHGHKDLAGSDGPMGVAFKTQINSAIVEKNSGKQLGQFWTSMGKNNLNIYMGLTKTLTDKVATDVTGSFTSDIAQIDASWGGFYTEMADQIKKRGSYDLKFITPQNDIYNWSINDTNTPQDQMISIDDYKYNNNVPDSKDFGLYWRHQRIGMSGTNLSKPIVMRNTLYDSNGKKLKQVDGDWRIIASSHYGVVINNGKTIANENIRNDLVLTGNNVKTVKLAQNTNENDLYDLADKNPNTIYVSDQNDGSFLVGLKLDFDTVPGIEDIRSDMRKQIANKIANSYYVAFKDPADRDKIVKDSMDFYAKHNYLGPDYAIELIAPNGGDSQNAVLSTAQQVGPNGDDQIYENRVKLNNADSGTEYLRPIAVNYLDTSDNNKQVKSGTAMGITNQNFTYTIKDSDLPEGFELVPNQAKVINYGMVHDKDNQPITIYLRHKIITVTNSDETPKGTEFSKSIHRTINITDPNNKTSSQTQTLTFTRTGTYDLATKKAVYNNWTEDSQSFSSVDLPSHNGYHPDRTVGSYTVTPKDSDITVTVRYVPNRQDGSISIYDDTANYMLDYQEFSGDSGSNSNFNTRNLIKKYTDLGYDLISDSTNGQTIIFDKDDNHDQRYELHFKHHIDNVADPAMLTATFDRKIIEDVPHSKAKEINLHYEAKRTGTYDRVTKQYKFTPWSKLQVPETSTDIFDGYTAFVKKSTPQNIVNMVDGQPVVIAEDFNNHDADMQGKNKSEVIEIGYNANIQKASVSFIDDTTGKTLTIKNLTGKSYTDSGYNTKSQIAEYQKQGYDLVSDNTSGKNIQFDEKDKVDQKYEVHLKHRIVNVTDPDLLTASFDRIITEHMPNSKNKQIKQHQSILRTGTQDLVTKAYRFSNWSKAQIHEDTVDSIKGYSAAVLKQAPNDISFIRDNKPVFKSEVFVLKDGIIKPYSVVETADVIYKANKYNAQLNFYDDVNRKLVKTVDSTGYYDSAISFNPDEKTVLNELLNKHYIFESSDFNNQKYTDNLAQNTFTIHLGHRYSVITQIRPVTETIHYKYADGTQAFKDTVNKLEFVDHGLKDLVNNTVEWSNKFEPETQVFDAVNSEKIVGYTADKAKIDKQTVTKDSKDLEFTVVYTKDQKTAVLNNTTDEYAKLVNTEYPEKQKMQDDVHMAQNKLDTRVKPANGKMMPVNKTNEYTANNSQIQAFTDDSGKTIKKDADISNDAGNNVAEAAIIGHQDAEQSLPQTGAKQDNNEALTALGLATIASVGLVSGIGAAKKKRD